MSNPELSPVFPLRDKTFVFDHESPSPIDCSSLFRQVTAFVEVRSSAENRSRAIAEELRQLGANVAERLGPHVTHVVYREGCRRTLQWAERHEVPLVSVGWIHACKLAHKLLPPADFPTRCDASNGLLEGSPSVLNARRRMRSMQPKSLEEDLKLSSERKRRTNRRNARRNELRRKVVEAEELLRSFENDSDKSKPDNYFADPSIYVAKTPPSMREFVERRGRRISQSSVESISPVASPSRNLLTGSTAGFTAKTPFREARNVMEGPGRSNSADSVASSSSMRSPRRRLVLSSRTEEVTPYPTTSFMSSSHRSTHCRKLFDASTFEAGVIIEPQTSSHRLQEMSSVFPKAFQKRKILGVPSNVVPKRNRRRTESFLPSKSLIENSEQEPAATQKMHAESGSEVESQTDFPASPDSVISTVSEANVRDRPSRVPSSSRQILDVEVPSALDNIDDMDRMRQLMKKPITTVRRSVRFSNVGDSKNDSSNTTRRRSTRLMEAARRSDLPAAKVVTIHPRRSRRSAPGILNIATSIAANSETSQTTSSVNNEIVSTSPISSCISNSKWVFGEEYDDLGSEKVYGVLEKPKYSRRLSKRCSAALVLQSLISHDSTSSNASTPPPSTRPRPSIDDFKCAIAGVPSARRKPQKAKLRSKRTIVLTSLHQGQQRMAQSTVSVLGGAHLRPKVDKQTTHVVTTWPIRRTLNILRARLLGVPILTHDWLLESREAGKWLPEKKFLIKELSDSELTPTSRQIFSGCANIFVAAEVSPPQRDLLDIISMAGGQESVTRRLEDAEIIISSEKNSPSPNVDPKWVLDSIMACKALPLGKYQCQE